MPRAGEIPGGSRATEGDLEAVVCRHSQRRQQRREGGTDVGTQRHGQHLVDLGVRLGGEPTVRWANGTLVF